MGGRGGSGGSKGGAGEVSRLHDVDGKSYIDLKGNPLKYADTFDGLPPSIRQKIDSADRKSYNRDKEHLTLVDKDGKVIGEYDGDEGSVTAPRSVRLNAYADNHNHPRRAGVLGGTFSVIDENGNGDMVNFVKLDNIRARTASAKEGIYYIEKTDNFNGKDFLAHMKQFNNARKTADVAKRDDLRWKRQNGQISKKKYESEVKKLVNNSLVSLHNEYLKNQKKYGYRYGLERRK